MVGVKVERLVVVGQGFLEAAHRRAGFRPLKIQRRVARVEGDRLAAVRDRRLVSLQLIGVGTRPGLHVRIGGVARRTSGRGDRLATGSVSTWPRCLTPSLRSRRSTCFYPNFCKLFASRSTQGIGYPVVAATDTRKNFSGDDQSR